MNTEQVVEISHGTCMVKGQPWSTDHLDSIQLVLQPSYILDYPAFFYKKVTPHHVKHSKHLYVSDILSPHLTLQTCTPCLAAHDDNCGL